jgi:hypothetical protein
VLRRLGYCAAAICTLPCIILTVPVSLFEVLVLGSSGEGGSRLASPFLWAHDRARGLSRGRALDNSGEKP